MNRTQLRRAQAVQENELWYIGEVAYDDQNIRVGVFSNEDAYTIRWGMGFDGNKSFFDSDLLISGLDSEGDINNIVLDWSRPGVLLFRDSYTNQEIASLSSSGLSALFQSQEVVTLSNSNNTAINGSLSVMRKVGYESSIDTDETPNYLIAPNWYVWSQNDATGILTVSFDSEDVILPDCTVKRVLTVATEDNPTKNGVRVWFFDYDFLKGQINTLSFAVKSPVGASSKTRVLNDETGVLNQKTIIGTNDWQIVEVPVFVPDDGSSWLAADLLFEPSANTADEIIWKIGRVQMNKGASRNRYEMRSSLVEKQMVTSIYQEGRVFVPDDSTTVTASLDLFGDPDEIEFENSADGTPTASNIDSTGFELEVVGLTNPNGAIIKYAAFLAPEV